MTEMVQVGYSRGKSGGEYYFVREDDELVFDTKVTDALEFGFGENFANGVVPNLDLVHLWVDR